MNLRARQAAGTTHNRDVQICLTGAAGACLCVAASFNRVFIPGASRRRLAGTAAAQDAQPRTATRQEPAACHEAGERIERRKPALIKRQDELTELARKFQVAGPASAAPGHVP
jgi:hypothetical protein